MRLALFDVDGTLVTGKSTEKRFIAWLFRHGHLGPRQLLSAAWFVLRWFPVYGQHVFRKNKAYLNGLDISLIAGEARRFAEALPESEWIPPAVDALRRHQDRGHTVVLMSGSLQPIVETLARRFGADGFRGAECRVQDGTFTASPPLRHPFHYEKAETLVSICEEFRVAAGDVCAYADSHFDIPMLSAVGQPVAVCPDSKLAAWATSKKHKILT
ncbi:MAG: HAD-IB family hydrolase [Woeseia sp.]